MACVNRSLVLLLALFAALAVMPAAVAQVNAPLDVIVVSGPLDQSMIRFVEESVEEAAANGSQAVVIQLDSEGALSDDIERLIDLFRQPPLPLVVWVGDAPAVAFGGAARLLIAAPLKTAAPGAEIGYLTPTVAGPEGGVDVVEATSSFTLPEEIVTVQGPIPGLVDAALPSIGQVVVWMNGREVTSQQGTATLQTARRETGEDGLERMLPTAQVRFHEPGLFTRFLRLSIQPEAAFFFLVMGLTVAAFEFYAIGPGLASATGVISLLIAGYGLAVLPVRWWALVLIGLGLFVYTAEVPAPVLRHPEHPGHRWSGGRGPVHHRCCSPDCSVCVGDRTNGTGRNFLLFDCHAGSGQVSLLHRHHWPRSSPRPAGSRRDHA